MNASDGNSSDVDAMESQASQLIHAALEQSPTSIADSKRAKSNKNLSVHSLTSSKNSAASSVHQYHFHGLASTQTQSHSDNEEDKGLIPNEGSQKENFESAKRNNGKDRQWTLPSPDWGPSPPQKSSSKDNTAKAEQSGTSRRPTKAKSHMPSVTHSKLVVPQQVRDSKSTDLPPPRPQERFWPQSSRRHNNRSSSPDFSQDSFAQGDSQLSEERLLVTSKKFTMPLADLARIDHEDIPTKTAGRVGVSQANYLLRNTHKPDDRSPVILVPSTPSQSGSSDYASSVGKYQSRSKEDDSYEQGQSAERTMLDNSSSRGSQYSQGFDGQDEVAEVQNLYSTKSSTNLGPARPQLPLNTNVFEETQMATQEATQIATQEAVVLTPSSVAAQTHTTINVGPRSLLNTMDQNKRNRYQRLLQYTPNSPISPAQQYPVDVRRLDVDDAKAQPIATPDQQKRTALLPEYKSPQIPSFKSPPKKIISKLPQQTSAPDAMDIVPDSEPMRETVQTSISEEKLMSVGGVNEVEQASDSEGTEDSDNMPPRKPLQCEEEEDQAIANKQEEEEEEEEEGTDDDDDEPLSARLRKARSKALVAPSKGDKPSGVTRTYGSKVGKCCPSSSDTPSLTNVKSVTKKKATSTAKRGELPRQQKANRKSGSTSERMNEKLVPSSIPNQDHPRTRKFRAATAKAKGKQPLRMSSRPTSVKSRRGRRSTTAEAEKDSDIEMEEVSDSEGDTQPADEPNEYMEPEIPSQSLKRKRGRPPKSKDNIVAAVTPITRLTKRLKSGSTTSTANATRVFALWSGNKLYYPGIVSESVGDGRYNIKFDDDAEGTVSTDDMRVYNLRTGDLVRVNSKKKDCRVHKVNLRTNMVTLEIDGETEDVSMKAIGISVKNITSTWNDRHIDKRSIAPAIRFSDNKPSPSPSRSAASFLSAKGSRLPPKFLPGVGLIVSLSGNGTNDRTKDGRLRTEILNAVRDSGGVLVDDLFKYLRMDLSHSSNRWVGDSTNVQWVGEPRELQRLFLLADDCNHKPKYLMALALGIPCLSVEWLYSCLRAGKELEWRSHLLPQGRPNAIDVQPSQQIDLNWGNRTEHLSELMTNPVAPRILKDQSILCVGPDMTPKSKSKDTDKGEAASYIIRIILAMGATRVEAVRDTSFAEHPLSHYDLLVIRDREQYHSAYSQTHTVDWNWIKDSLIMSRFLPMPDWPVEEESQCSQNL
ncbi:hypothetical protein AGABI1DRAFT_104539 [Agaricus bisporus var. burnettii JB137-S8]|uniref:BRCT domain-containing protein n=1 Tax=Agaricus bisporus var. burnettii (strain JB137-S8 / ATCC MYA-4627 / FGSC 10392) TaxID=597362 RepID=K5XGR5_AGABU|nr:uncharacterized protein AGABI1DRAFT_104539 [Agaricus bisporus var. burnettii JB137-S8]EKM82613.1 hypothetical protein AGABI1DRAFT_104539 [Agaricus bisporus var. burnettii JB137-S8]